MQNEEKKIYSWEEVYETLQLSSYEDILDTEFETGRYYEIPMMITYFKEKGDQEKVDFLIDLENSIEEKEGRKIVIGDVFLLDDENVKCEVEVIDFDENGAAYVEYSEIEYKTDKKEITTGIS